MIHNISLKKLGYNLLYFIALLIIQIKPHYASDNLRFETDNSSKLIKVSRYFLYAVEPEDYSTYTKLPAHNNQFFNFNDCQKNLIVDQHFVTNQAVSIKCHNLLITGSIKASEININAHRIVCYNTNLHRLLKYKTRDDFIRHDEFLNNFLCEPGSLIADRINMTSVTDTVLLSNMLYGKDAINIITGNILHIDTGRVKYVFQPTVYDKSVTNLSKIKHHSPLPQVVISSAGDVTLKASFFYFTPGLMKFISGKFECI